MMHFAAIHVLLHLLYILGILLKPETQTKATGQTIELTCKVHDTGIDELTYQWTILGLVVVNASSVLTIPNATVNDSGIYFCVVHVIGGSNDGIKSNIATISILSELKKQCC